MQGAVPTPAGMSFTGGHLASRYRGYVGAVVAAFVGLLVLPAAFHALAQHDVQISGRFSLLATVWLILGLVVSGYLIAARDAILGQAATAIRTRLEAVKGLAADAAGPAVAPVDLAGAGSATVGRLLDLIFLLVIQAILRAPLIAVAKAWASEALVDGGFVILVFLVALGLLIGMRGVSRPLIDRLLWLGLDQVVPTAGFATSNASETFTRMTTTQTGSGSKPAAAIAAPAGASFEPPRGPADAVAATVASPNLTETVAAPEAAQTTSTVSQIEATDATVAEAAPRSPELPPNSLPSPFGEATLANIGRTEEQTEVDQDVIGLDETIAPTAPQQDERNQRER